jgi:hypothetical protein
MRILTHVLLLAGALLFISACTPAEDETVPADAGGSSSTTATPAASSDSGGAAAAASTEAPAQPPPVAFGGPTTTEGLPSQDEDGKSMDTLAALQYASEVYERLKAMDYPDDEEAAKRWKPRPPLTDLQQLVQYRIIRAVPAAPAGQKYVYDAQTKKVKLVSQ